MGPSTSRQERGRNYFDGREVGTRRLPAARTHSHFGQGAGTSTHAAWALISGELRQFVAERAGYHCEYCLLHEDDTYSPHQIDHIIGGKHGGLSTPDNLAFACLRCNAWKGSDIGSFDPETGRLVSIFNPRQQA